MAAALQSSAPIFRLVVRRGLWYHVPVKYFGEGARHMQESFYTVPGCPARVALASDLHERPYDAVLASLRRSRPELICVPGDFFFGFLAQGGVKVRESGMLPFFSACAALAPCYVSLGNHEWMISEEDMALIREAGGILLHDAYAVREAAGTRLVIGGLSSSMVNAYRHLLRAGFSPEAAFHRAHARSPHTPPELDWLNAYCAEPGYHILLCHHPEYYPRYLRGRRVELILSGHAHGGQIRLFGRGLYAPGQGLFPRLTSGVTDGRLVVSRGLANRERVPRLWNPTELVYISG